MKQLHLVAMGAAIIAATPASAQQRSVGGGPRIAVPSHSNHFSWEKGHGFKGGFGGGIWIVEREVPVYVEVPVAPPAPSPLTLPSPPRGEEKAPRKPYVIGASYASLPGSCMKLIEEGVSFYYCSGEWYRQSGWGRGSKYVAVAKP